jgi:ABC-2 type transport system permease protein
MIDLRKTLEIARINLLRQVRDRSDLFFVFVLPTIIIVALGLQFGGAAPARLGVVSPADDAAAAALVEALGADSARLEVRLVADEATLRSLVERGQVEAGVVIPAGFGDGLAGTGSMEIRYLGTNDALTLGLRAPVEAAVARVSAVTTAARVAVLERAGDWAAASAAAGRGYASVAGVEVLVTRAGEAGMFAGFGQFTFGASTQLLLFMFLTSMTASGKLVYTRQLGVSRRMIATPTSSATIVAGEALGRFGVAILQGGYIVLVTAIAFGVSWGDPLAAAVIIALFGGVAAGVAMLFGSIAKTPDQASSLGIFAGLAFAALGGCMIPFQIMPEVMQSISRAFPHSWALLGLQSLVRDGGGLESVLPNIGVLAAFAVVALGLASWRFRKAIAG